MSDLTGVYKLWQSSHKLNQSEFWLRTANIIDLNMKIEASDSAWADLQMLKIISIINSENTGEENAHV